MNNQEQSLVSLMVFRHHHTLSMSNQINAFIAANYPNDSRHPFMQNHPKYEDYENYPDHIAQVVTPVIEALCRFASSLCLTPGDEFPLQLVYEMITIAASAEEGHLAPLFCELYGNSDANLAVHHFQFVDSCMRKFAPVYFDWSLAAGASNEQLSLPSWQSIVARGHTSKGYTDWVDHQRALHTDAIVECARESLLEIAGDSNYSGVKVPVDNSDEDKKRTDEDLSGDVEPLEDRIQRAFTERTKAVKREIMERFPEVQSVKIGGSVVAQLDAAPTEQTSL